MQTSYNVVLSNGHILIDDSQRIIIDTGSPKSFHTSGRIVAARECCDVPSSLPGLSAVYLTEKIGCEIKGLLGMDIYYKGFRSNSA